MALAASILGVASSLIVKEGPEIAMQVGADGGDFTTTEVNHPTTFNYGNVGGWIGDELQNTSEALPNATQCQYFRNVQNHGQTLFGEETIEGLSDMDWALESIDKFHFDKTNVNLYADPASSARFTLCYDVMIFTELKRIAAAAETSFVVPALTFGDSLEAVFSVTAEHASLITPNGLVSSVSQSWHVENVVEYYTSGGSPVSRQVYYQDFTFTFKKGAVTKVPEIGTISYGSFSSPEDKYPYLEYDQGYVQDGFRMYIPSNVSSKVVSLPYEVTFLDYQGGEICLGHSAYGETYGIAEHAEYLKDITLEIYSNKKTRTVTFQAMTENEYILWRDYNSHYDNKFAYLSRGRYEDEVGGEGSLVRAYHVPFKEYEITESSWITVKSISFYSLLGGSSVAQAFIPDDFSSRKITIPNEMIRYEFYADKAIARSYVEFVGKNISNETVSNVKFTDWQWARWILGILSLGVSEAHLAIATGLANAISNGTHNIQRLYFNAYDSLTNQRIENIFKMDFKYQIGRKQVNIDSNGGLIKSAKPYDDLDYYYACVEKKDSDRYQAENVNIGFFMFDFEGAVSDGFVSVEDDPVEVDGIKYDYFYQNVYETKNYSDYMCWWDPLSIWYEVPDGKTVRSTNTTDGTYAVLDPNGQYVVLDMDGNKVDQTFEDWLSNVQTNNINHGIDDGEKNNTGINLDGFTGWRDQIGQTIDKWKVVIGIALGILGAVLLIFLVIKIFGSFGGGSKTVVKIQGQPSGKSRRRKK